MSNPLEYLSYDELMTQNYSQVPIHVSIAFIVLTTVAYAVRFWARWLKRIRFGLDDWIMLPAFGFQIALDACAIMSAIYGSGRHAPAVIQENSWSFNDWGIYDIYVIPFIYEWCVLLPKCSILLLYVRVFPNKISRWCCWFIMFILFANLITEYITVALQCGNQMGLAWMQWIYPGTCNDISIHYTYASLPNTVTDVAMLILPIPTLWKLSMEWPAKLGAWMTIALGSLGTITSILRLVDFLQNDWSEDGTWFAGTLLTWTIIESSSYFISACLVTYRPLIQLFYERTGLNQLVTRLTASTGGSRGSKVLSSFPQSRDTQRSSLRAAGLDPGGVVEKGYGPTVTYSCNISALSPTSCASPTSPQRAHLNWPLCGHCNSHLARSIASPSPTSAPTSPVSANFRGSITTDLTSRRGISQVPGPERSWLRRPSSEWKEDV